MLFQISQLSLSNILLFDIPKNLLDVFLKRTVIGKHSLGCISSCGSNFSFNCLVVHKIIDVSLDLIESYTTEVADNIYYFS
jgi:hypothetical protein